MTALEGVLDEITKDTVQSIVGGDTMVPVCNVGPLLEIIEDLEMKLNGNISVDCEVSEIDVVNAAYGVWKESINRKGWAAIGGYWKTDTEFDIKTEKMSASEILIDAEFDKIINFIRWVK